VETEQGRDKLDALLREANVFRLRGQAEEAEARCRAALELAPEDATALEMMGDLVRGRGQTEAAADFYKRAVAAAPGRPSPEKKYAEVTLELADRARQREVVDLLLEPAISPQQQRRNVMTAFLLSAFFPGLGQFYNREGIKGALLVVSSLACLALGGDQLMRLLLTVATTRPSGEVNSMGAWLGLLSGVLWIYAVIDAVVTAQKRNAGAGPLG
jgi:tetratricopeptide (TPR) repeat protein